MPSPVFCCHASGVEFAKAHVALMTRLLSQSTLAFIVTCLSVCLSVGLYLSPKEFGMREDLRKMDVVGVSSRELYAKREYLSF